MGYGNLEGVLIGQAGSEKRTLTDTRALRQAVVNSLTASNADGVARLKCARVPGEAETHFIQPDSESKMSVLWGKKKRKSQAKGNRQQWIQILSFRQVAFHTPVVHQ